jgi:hypothetical protein
MAFTDPPTHRRTTMKALKTTLLSITLAVLASTAAAGEPATLLRNGNWGADVGSYEVPKALQTLPPQRWPAEGWVRLDWLEHGLRATPVAATSGGQPAFLRSIAAQVQAAMQGQPDRGDTLTETNIDDPLPMYLRAPGGSLREGFIPAYRFRNGTRELRPQLDRRYELIWQGQPFAFTVQDGLRTADGKPYGEVSVYTIEIGGVSHRYVLPGHGFDTAIQAIADIDGDGKPDFFISQGGNNLGLEAVLLSTQAKPGNNTPSATLVSFGC